MKKTIIALMSIFALSSCSDDTLENAETQTESTGVQNGIKTVTNGHRYISPWDFNNRQNVTYGYLSGYLNSYATGGLAARITPYIGLAYFDGSDDGVYNTPTGSYNLASGAYPNLYANGSEYGNYITANPFILVSGAHTNYQWDTHELFIYSDVPNEHCPLVNVNAGQNFNNYAINFNVINNNIVQPAAFVNQSVPATPGTIAEANLLREYGKVMYYKVEYHSGPLFNSNTGFAHYVLAHEADMGDPEWTSIGVSDMPFGAPLYYHSGNGSTVSPSYEIVADRDNISYPNFQRHNVPFVSPYIPGNMRNIYSMYFYDVPAPVPPGTLPKGTTLVFE